MKFEDIHLLKDEKRSLRSFRFKKMQEASKIKCFKTLYYDYHFIEQSFHEKHHVMYSLSREYFRYRIFLREKRLNSLPNWVAITISVIALVINAVLLWLQFRLSGLL